MQGDETDNGWNSEITEVSNITELLAQRFIEHEAPVPRARVRLNTVRTPPPVMESNEPSVKDPDADTAPGRQRVSVASPTPAPITVATFRTEVVAAPQPPPDTSRPHVEPKRQSQLDRYLPLDDQTMVEIPVPGAPVEYSSPVDEPSWGGRRPTLALAEVAVLGWVATFRAAMRRAFGLRVSHEALEDELLPPAIHLRLFRLAVPLGLVAGIVMLGAVFTKKVGGTAHVAATTGVEAPAPAPVIARRSPVVEVKVVRRRRGRRRR